MSGEAMTHPPERDWMIVAPWWHWSAAAVPAQDGKLGPDPAQGRLSRPVFQKYDSPKLVNDFIANPQRRLKFTPEDLVHSLQPSPEPLLSKGGNKLLRLAARWGKDEAGDPIVIDQRYLPDGTHTRKLFLPSHKRYYLLVCEIHCDSPGFPKAARAKICKAGFVIRRRTFTAPGCALDEVKPILGNLSKGRARLARVTRLAEMETAALAAATGKSAGVQEAKLESLLKTRASLQALVDAEQARFELWVRRYGVVPQLQGWFPSPAGLDKIGCWAPVDEMPAELGSESSFPLYPLIPDAGDPGHAGNFGTVYFGILPTGSHDCEASGRARFDDREFYQVHCWVERHRTPHDPDQPCRCPDRLFWSVASEPYRLASHFDLAGTSHQPVTIQLPDLNELAAQARPTLGVGFAQPADSLSVAGDKDGKIASHGRTGGFEICFLPIPLITIVATFVLQLFLPVVTFLFGLWWMLALKFCLPPKIEVAAGVSAELGLDGRIGLDVEADVEARLDTALLAPDPADPLGRSQLEIQFGIKPDSELATDYSSIAVANLELDIEAVADSGRREAPSATADLEFEAEVEHA